MRKFGPVCALLLLLPIASRAGEFEWMTREFARQSGTRALHIPFFGLARLVVAVAQPAGTSDVKLAIFEHTNVSQEEFSRIAAATISQAWKPIVRVREQAGDAVSIYVQEEGKHVRVLVASLEGHEAVLVEVRVRPEELMHFIEQQRRRHQA